jgi:hypothetical protein
MGHPGGASWRTAIVLAACIAVGAVAAGAQAPVPVRDAMVAASCQNLRLTAPVTRAWARAFVRARRLGHLRVRRVRGSFYGRCGPTHYGRAVFVPRRGQRVTERQQVLLQDQPDVFRRVAGGRWRDISDTGGDVPCGGRRGYPRALVRVWHLRCS